MRSIGILLVGLLVATSAGCRLDTGSSGGRVPPYDPDGPGQKEINMTVAYEFCDIVAERLAQNLAELPAVKTAQTRLVLELGDIRNKTDTPETDFEMIQKRVQGQLTGSDLVQASFMVVSGPNRMDAENQRINGGTPFQSQASRYDPKISYVLLGDFYESVRAGRKRFLLQFTLTNLATREIVFQETYDHAQLR